MLIVLPESTYEIVSILIVVTIILFCFFFLGLTSLMINSKGKKIENYGQVLNRKNKMELKKETRAVICLFLICLNTTLCFIPIYVLNELLLFQLINFKSFRIFIPVFTIFNYLYQLTDPFIVIIFNRNIRGNLKRLLFHWIFLVVIYERVMVKVWYYQDIQTIKKWLLNQCSL